MLLVGQTKTQRPQQMQRCQSTSIRFHPSICTACKHLVGHVSIHASQPSHVPSLASLCRQRGVPLKLLSDVVLDRLSVRRKVISMARAGWRRSVLSLVPSAAGGLSIASFIMPLCRRHS